MILYKKPSFIKEIIYVWCLGTAIMFGIGLILAVGNTLFSYLNL